MSFNRTLGNLGKAIDSASSGTFLQRDDATDVDFVSIEYSDLSGTPTALDSAAAINLIDSAYIQLRQGSLGGGGLDSAAVTTLVDSNYVSARTSDLSSGFFMYDYVATAGQTTFQDSDANGNVLSYGNGGILVFYNGILMRRGSSYDYIEGTNSVTLNTAADSAANITISKWTYTDGSADIVPFYGDRAITGTSNSYDYVQYHDITTLGNASDFGTLINSRAAQTGTLSDATYALFGGGYNADIDYVTISTIGNASDFGDQSLGRSAMDGSCDGTYGVWGGGYVSSVGNNTIDYVTVATPGNASDFGDMTQARWYCAAFNNGTYGFFCGGTTGAPTNVIDYITMVTPGNASDVGDLTESNSITADACSNNTYAIINQSSGQICYMAMTTSGNASDFGDLTDTRSYCAASNNSTRATFSGGTGGTTKIDYVTIDTPGNASTFGTLSGTQYVTGASGNAS